MVIRTYSCLNRRCRAEYDSTENHPPCPRCGGLRVQWIPRGFNIRGERTSAIDATARQLAADFGLSNFRTPVAGEAAIARPPAPPPAPAAGEKNAPMTYEPMPGWRVRMPDSALAGRGHAVCLPTGVTAKVKVDPNAGPLSETQNPQMSMRAMRAATQIEASHRPPSRGGSGQ